VFDHVTIRVSDRQASRRFYEALLGALGAAASDDGDYTQWADFSIVAAERPDATTEGLHIGFTAPARAQVDTAWSAGLEAGGRDDGAPGLRPRYRDDYYGGFLLDPDGNSAEPCHHGARRDDGVVDHVWLRVADVAASAAFYSTVARVAGHQVVEHSPGHVEVKGASGSFSLVAGRPTRNLHMAFGADDDATVDAFHAVAVGAGHPSDGEPGERPVYHPGYYAAFVLDPDGNSIEIVNHNR
jgi:catechol 2,3-dioxygenase-like lactoylglutathione lyase family enzyme